MLMLMRLQLLMLVLMLMLMLVLILVLMLILILILKLLQVLKLTRPSENLVRQSGLIDNAAGEQSLSGYIARGLLAVGGRWVRDAYGNIMDP